MFNMWPCIGKLGEEKSKYIRVEQTMSDYLSAQSRPDPKGGLCCLWTLNKTWTPPISTFGALKIIKKY
jgi:hypothetical protein